ncbi:carboxymuconolactone decarboxylase family protein [Psychromicrobium sp. YIM B11713]|uniref:carboxymuconolactone decarboxylase family protein n=1 Tax=Psychromicrobium sp. YIM B11713 TaxID=3145233 RepID=UPI00374EE9E3
MDSNNNSPARRIRIPKVDPAFYQAMNQLTDAAAAGLDPLLAELIKIRASQINGCAFCLDVHLQESRALGESQQRLDILAGWHESPSYFTEQEQAALALTEAITLLPEAGVPDGVYQRAAEAFGDTGLSHVMEMIIAINAWNRIGVATRLSPPRRREASN